MIHVMKQKKLKLRRKILIDKGSFGKGFIWRAADSAMSREKGLRVVKYADMADGKLKLVCQLTKEKIEALVKNGQKVEILSPVNKSLVTKQQRMQQRRYQTKVHRPILRRKARLMSQTGGTIQREEMTQMYWAVVEIARKMERVFLTLPDDDGKKPTGLFRDFVDEGKLAVCFKKVSVDFYGIDRKEELKGSGRDVPTFMAYLFILVEHEHIGSGSFSEKGIKPFFRFIQEQGVVNVKCTPRTFYNRLTGNLGTFRKRMQNESRDSQFQQDYWQRNIYLENFLKVREIFHATDYYNVLKPLLQ